MALAPLQKNDLRQLRAPLLRLTLMVAAGLGSVVAAWHQYSTVTDPQRASALLRAQMPPTPNAADQQRARSIVGTENRPAWTDRVRAINAGVGSMPLDVEWLPRQILSQGTAFTLVASPMRLRFRPRHEEQLLSVIAHLQTSPGVLVRPTRCRLERVAGDLAALRADCQLDWIHAEARP